MDYQWTVLDTIELAGWIFLLATQIYFWIDRNRG